MQITPQDTPQPAETLLAIHGLTTVFPTSEGEVRAVDGLDLEIQRGETMAVVGESGSGKSVTALSILRLIPTPGKISTGEILLAGEDLLGKTPRQMRMIRGREIAMIFQEPMSSLNPAYTIGDQITESIRLHQHLKGQEAVARAVEMLRLVGMPLPEKRVSQYPHELSGGMKQRVMIAIALSCRPKLLIADEPTASLDVTIQAQILELLKDLRQKVGTTTLLISHDLGVVAEMADRVAVMYAGQVVEIAAVHDLFHAPAHPYTAGLLRSVIHLHTATPRLAVIPGHPQDRLTMTTGCRFQDRCSLVEDRCRVNAPPMTSLGDRSVRCFRPFLS